MAQRYISNNLPPQSMGSAPSELLPYVLEMLLKHAPPLPAYTERHLGGLFTGYTGLAYLFLQLSAMHPDLQVAGHTLIYWADQYLTGDRGSLVLDSKCGIGSEKLSFEAVRACITKDKDDVIEFLSNIPRLLGPYPTPQDDPFASEIISGRAGTLYLLRIVRHWVPEYAPLIESPLHRLTECIMATDDDGRGNWEWHGKRYFGAAHGDIGIITQLVLSNPSLAPQLSSRLERLIELQAPDGNWPEGARSLKQGRTPSLVQWCHGAPGFIYSLLSLRPYFPLLQEQIDTAVTKGQGLIWRHGLLTKEPSLCHGIFGNAL
ncbi:hypothetical protein B0J13DRAFT_541875 [Dactylonectria estremocensis]|uniref:Uncharacterized protein n=1 Tax=Dactylonectria estremocensis TaxID=1079267 RepID=A0A9P9JGV3_9HYPO|nr:hypothetical protein B0J13DRAFT_541875 [Dactylonectria estremocensis]